MWLDDDGSVYNNKSYDHYYISKIMLEKSNKKLKTKKDTESLNGMDIKFIENYLRKKKLEIINKK